MMPVRRKKGGHHQSARAHHIYSVLHRKNPSWSKSHTWAAVMGMSPKTLSPGWDLALSGVGKTYVRQAHGKGRYLFSYAGDGCCWKA